jgi:hypothetical protein
MALRRAAVVAALVLALVPAAARAAVPPEHSRYAGATAQGRAIGLDVGPARRVSFRFQFAPSCATLQIPVQFDEDTVAIHTTGRFVDRFEDAYRPDDDPVPIVGGRGRHLLLVSRVTLSGRFVGRTLATGTIRDAIVVMDADAFPTPVVLDRCDTGAMAFRAHRI